MFTCNDKVPDIDVDIFECLELIRMCDNQKIKILEDIQICTFLSMGTLGHRSQCKAAAISPSWIHLDHSEDGTLPEHSTESPRLSSRCSCLVSCVQSSDGFE